MCFLHRAPQLLSAQRQLQFGFAEVAQGITRGVHQGRRRTNATASPTPLVPSRLCGLGMCSDAMSIGGMSLARGTA